MKKIRKNQQLIICPDSKQFTDLVVCAANCDHKCDKYAESITYEILLDFVENHPEYKIIGELVMATEQKKPAGVKKFWIIDEEKKLTEVSEKQIMNNPQNFIGKDIWQKPPFKYEIVITLKKVKAD